ncbi:PilZ domain-containing protein [Desulfovibrio subterraneus]|uniref:Pilus assembly protein PilZ n=1 Tax=Desulfovibrio subterraneus TaxID=2718620 RepID=A0A7J0BI52_9BACT|nr:PilZ domain-containing protein [Desulfovibrio subterraneus]WBF67612.1 PilZ domain-containing protein [Desulfovibrio subterraneus]GFM33443.1 pilus assembly protein PilZ [Desulfovibrio subterraneus]
MTSYDFSLDNGESLRRAFRAQVPGLEGWFADRQKRYPVKDISATGFAILDHTQSFKQGDSLKMDLLIKQRLYVGAIPCQVVRVLDNGIVGFDYLPLDLRQEARIDKLVLEVQKRSIANKHAGSEED